MDTQPGTIWGREPAMVLALVQAVIALVVAYSRILRGSMDMQHDHEQQGGHRSPTGVNSLASQEGQHAAGGDHSRHAGHSVAMFRDRFRLSLVLTLPILIWSPDLEAWLGYTAPTFPGSQLIPPILGTIVFLYGGLVFLRGGVRELRDRQPGMMTLISLAILVAFVASWAGTLGLFEIEIWWELASLITIMLLGHWLEMRSINQAQGALAALAELLPDEAERVTATGTETVALDALQVDDVGRDPPRVSGGGGRTASSWRQGGDDHG